MSKHTYRISEILTPTEDGQRPEHSAAIVGITPPIEFDDEFAKVIVGSSRNVSIGYLATTYERANRTGQSWPSESFIRVDVGGNHYDETQRETAIHTVARRMCALANDPMIALQIRTEDPVPHRPVN